MSLPHVAPQLHWAILVVGLLPLVWSGLVHVFNRAGTSGRASEIAGMRLELAVLAFMVAPVAVGGALLLGAPLAPQATLPHFGLVLPEIDMRLPNFVPAAATATVGASAPHRLPHAATLAALLSPALVSLYLLGFALAALRLLRARARLDAAAATGVLAPELGEGVRISDHAVPTHAGARGAIVLSRALIERLTEEDIVLVVRHERAHIERGDPRTFWALAWIDALFWFNPFVRSQTARCRLAAELSCDEEVVSVAPQRRMAYAQSLVSALRHAAQASPAWASAHSAGSAGEHRMRLTQIMTSARRDAGPRRWAALAAAGLLGAPLAALQLACAQAPAVSPAPAAAPAPDPVAASAAPAPSAPPPEENRAAPAPPPPPAEGDRTFRPDVGEAVVGANRMLTVELKDFEGALAELNRALAMNPTPYELGVILYMRGGVKYQLDDVAGALADWERALAEGSLNPTERLSITYNIAQLHLSRDEFREAADAMEEWIRQGGAPNEGVRLNMVAAYVELGDLQSALRHAREAFALADPPERRHYNTLDFIYGELGMTDERNTLRAATPQEYLPPGEQRP
jgi:tetratricopeptide (TPR) repeat protein/Zn-dependent protease with chaperone function